MQCNLPRKLVDYTGKFLLGLFLLSVVIGCVTNQRERESDDSVLAQKQIMNNDFEKARETLSRWYKSTNINSEKGEALYWTAYTYIKENAYKDARNHLDVADKLYRSGPLLGAISSRIIACALNDYDEDRALRQYRYIEEKRVGEMAEINFLMGQYYVRKSHVSEAKNYLNKCVNSGNNIFARKAKSILSELSEGGYYLQLGVYSTESSAQAMANKIKIQYRLDVYIKAIKRNESVLYAVCLGSYAHRFDAERDLRLYQNRYRTIEMVVRP